MPVRLRHGQIVVIFRNQRCVLAAEQITLEHSAIAARARKSFGDLIDKPAPFFDGGRYESSEERRAAAREGDHSDERSDQAAALIRSIELEGRIQKHHRAASWRNA
jgi:hypothetical protein